MRAGPVPDSPPGRLAPFAEPSAVTGGPPGHLEQFAEPSAGSARGHFPRRHLAAGGPGRSPPGHHSQAALLGAWSRTAVPRSVASGSSFSSGAAAHRQHEQRVQQVLLQTVFRTAPHPRGTAPPSTGCPPGGPVHHQRAKMMGDQILEKEKPPLPLRQEERLQILCISLYSCRNSAWISRITWGPCPCRSDGAQQFSGQSQ